MPYKTICLVGLGASGLGFLLSLSRNKDKLKDIGKIVVIDVGRDFSKRKSCPLDTGVLKRCPPVPCLPCTPSTSGGIFNDYKVILSASPTIGGRLYDLIGKESLQDHIDIIKETILSNSPVEIPIVKPSDIDLNWINNKTKAVNMEYSYQELLHAGTDMSIEINKNILQNIKDSLGDILEFKWGTKVSKIDDSFKVYTESYRIKNPTYDTVNCDYLVIAVGRGGTKWLSEQDFYKNLSISPGRVDIGVRVETLKKYTDYVDRVFYEPKIYFKSSMNDDVRNFCANPGGFVTPEHHGEYVLVNGHSKMMEKSENNNFAILVSKTFTLPFKNPQLYARNIAQTTNMLAGGGPLVQRFGDLLSGRRSKILLGNKVIPTLDAECGDISLAYPHRIMEGIIQYIKTYDNICPGVADKDTLLYAPEIKTFPDNIDVNKNMQTNIKNLFIIGDCSSHTRSLSSAMVSGLLAGEYFSS